MAGISWKENPMSAGEDEAEPSWAADLLEHRDGSATWPAPPRESGDWQIATVEGVLAETPGAVTLRLRRSAGGDFLPGQHFNLEVPVGSRFPALEAYSVASSPWPDPRTLDFTVKEVPGGRTSPVLVRKVPVGAALRIEGPFGNLTWSEADGGPLALIAGGSGIVPLMAIVRYAAAKGLAIPTRLLYSSKDRLNTIYQRELSTLARQGPWLEVVHTFTVDKSDELARHHRRIDDDMVIDTFASMAYDCLAYACGPPGMVRTAEAALVTAGVDPDRITSEEWD